VNSEGGDVSGAGGEDQKEGGKEGVNLSVSGALAAETNTFNNVLVKYSEPPEARKPRKKWRLYVFKGRGRPEKCFRSLQ
jgi:smad nuclear-interacting protein 1